MPWLSSVWLALLLDVSVKSLLLAVLAAGVLWVLRVRDANVRHRVWTGVLAGMLALPLLVPVTPGLPVRAWLLPAFPRYEVEEELEAAASLPSTGPAEPAGATVSPSEPGLEASQVPPPLAAQEAPLARRLPDDAGRGTFAPQTPTERPRAAEMQDGRTHTVSNQAGVAGARPGPAPASALWPAAILAAYVCVGAFLGLRLLIGFLAARRLTAKARPIPLAGLGVSGDEAGALPRVAILESSSVRLPLAVGWLRPKVLLPPQWRTWSQAKRRAVLAHELAHVDRGDCLVTLLAECNRCLYWFHPLAWYLRSRLLRLAEQSCDDAAIASIGDRTRYARHLLEVAGPLAGRRGRLVASASVPMARGANVETRITAILDPKRPLASRLGRLGTAVLIGIFAPAVLLAAALRPASERAAAGAGQTAAEAAEAHAPPAAQAAAAVAPSAPASPQETPAEAPADNGDEPPIPAGARVTLIHDRQEYLLGENILIHYRLENVGTEPLPYGKGGFFPTFRRIDGYRVTAVPIDQAGTVIGDPLEGVPGPEYRGGPMGRWSLKPGEVYEQTLYLPRYVRLEQPGRYCVRITNVDRHDPERRFSVGETTIRLNVPSPEQARAVYEGMKKLPDGPVASYAERRDQVIADFETMLHPAYLPILLEYARQGDRDALPSLGKMHTLPSSEALIAVVEQGLRDDDVELSLAAYHQMGDRLPNPRFNRQWENLVMPPEVYAAERRFVERLWRPEFAGPLRRLASRLAGDAEAKALKEISFIYECVGTAEDIAHLMRGYTKSIEATKTLPMERQYFRPRGSAYHYRFSTRQLLRRGATVPANPETTGAAAVYFIAMQMRDDFRPADWPEQVARWLKHETPYMREFVLEYMPEPIPEAALEMLPELLADDYVDLQIAACHTAAKHPRQAFRQPILTILQTETEKYLLNFAAAAGPANGISNDQIMEVWLDRLGNDDLGGRAVVRLLLTVLDDNQCRFQPTLDPEVQAATKARWSRFIEEHREKLRRGHRFQLGDPEITPDLFPPGFQFYFDGKPWPASSRQLDL